MSPRGCIALLIVCSGVRHAAAQPSTSNPLSSWTDGPAKKSIIDFVTRVTKSGSPDFVPQEQRIATCCVFPKLILLTIKTENQWEFRNSSDGVPSLLLETQMATCRCCNGPALGTVHALRWLFATLTRP
jgi:hypothetical protein